MDSLKAVLSDAVELTLVVVGWTVPTVVIVVEIEVDEVELTAVVGSKGRETEKRLFSARIMDYS